MLDPIFSNLQELVVNAVTPIPWSDHFLLTCVVEVPISSPSHFRSTKVAQRWSKLPLDALITILRKTSPSVCFDPIIANDHLNNWLNSALDCVLPKTEISEKPGGKSNPWYSQDLRLLKQSCKRLERAWRKDFSVAKKSEYREAIKLYKMEIKKPQSS